MDKIVLFFVFLALSTFKIYAQHSEAIIKGKIEYSADSKNADVATVSLYRLPDSSLVKISLSDKEGNFEFNRILPGRYFLLATSTGYSGTYSAAISIRRGDTVTVGVLQLNETIKILKGVTVALNKPFVERKIDRTIINVDASITNAGTTALEVLEKAPGVSVDKDGNVSLKGKSGVMIMLDGRPTYLSADQLSTLLKNMPSSNIDQIEIMTNPSAKYDATGNAGIINIKTKKNKMKGLNGNISTSLLQSKYTQTNNSLNLNYRTGKVNFFGNYGYSYRKRYQETHIIRKFRDSSSKEIETIFDQNNLATNSWQVHNLKAGMDFYANKKTTLGVVFSGFLNPSDDLSRNQTNLNDGKNKTDSIVIADNTNTGKSNNFSANFNMQHVFDSSGKEFTVDLDYLKYDQITNQALANNYYYPDFSHRAPSSQLIGTLPSDVHIYSAKTDFTFPLKHNAKIETGLKSSYVTTDNDALYQDSTSAGYVTDNGKTNHFIYKENINAAYFNYNKQIKKWGIQAGLRAENTNADGNQLGNSTRPDSSFTKNYVDLFPTVFVSYQANKENTFSANYGRRIDRPDYEDLNPFYYFLDEYTYEVGNTLLQPQYTDNIEITHTYKGFLSTTINYSKIHNVFTDVLKQITSERKTFQTKENLSSKDNYGLAISANFPVTSFWNTNLYADVNHDIYYGVIDDGVLNVANTSFLFNMNNQLKFKKGWSAELSGFYRSKAIEGQIVINPLWRMDAGLQKSVLKNKGTLKASVRDIFNSQNFTGRVNYQDIDVYIQNINNNRTFSLTFLYRFGKPLKNQNQRRSGGASDEQSRIKSAGN
ncbi:MAG TPA: TonB-dependent receptor [Hanamia sp.]